MFNQIQKIMDRTINGKYPTVDDFVVINNDAIKLIEERNITEEDIMSMDMILAISNILYNNTSMEVLPLDDGVYDKLVEKYKQYKEYEIKSTPIEFDPYNGGSNKINNAGLIDPISFLDDDAIIDTMFLNNDNLFRTTPIDMGLYESFKPMNSNVVLKKMNVKIPHKYPKLVGTLDKCKFVMDSEAIYKGVYDDENVRIFERDFIQKYYEMFFKYTGRPIRLVLELKYDGVSVEADVTDQIESARTRGDTDADIAGDLSPLFNGYKFRNAPPISKEESFGMKFEAVITKSNMEALCRYRNKNYVNGRVAIIGLLGASDAYDYRNFITLIPLETSLNIDRLTELNFMNKYYNSGEYNRYAIVEADSLESALYQVRQFVIEAQMIRDIMPYMYDGVVVSFLDEDIREAIGREGAINKYSTAIKFEPLSKRTIFRGYSYTIGQNGVVTPLLHYLPVDFYGSVHSKSSGHSYNRFLELGLKENDYIDVEYTNDVMPYATKADCVENYNNKNPIIQFPTECPMCGMPLKFTDKSAICENFTCPGIVENRVTNMVKKLNLKNFSTSKLRELEIKGFYDLVHANPRKLNGGTNQMNFAKMMGEFLTAKHYDYKLIGAIGFTNIAETTWKKILSRISLEELYSLDKLTLHNMLVNTPDIGEKTASTIAEEKQYFLKDIKCIMQDMNLIKSADLPKQHTVRFTGVRDKELEEQLRRRGIDASDGPVTKTTDVLIVPYYGYVSSKTSKIGPNTLVMDLDTFKNHTTIF